MTPLAADGRAGEPFAFFDGWLATRLEDVTGDLAALDSDGWWAVSISYEGVVTCARFGDVRPAASLPERGKWRGPDPGSWATSMGRSQYVRAVEDVRAAIAAGSVYQANICRVLSAALPDAPDLASLAAVLGRGNPAPYAGVVDLPSHNLRIVSASPELFLSRAGDQVRSGPIKGTAPTREGLLPKDEAENVMIADLVRNDLSRVCRTGSVEVPSLLAVEEHPGLVHLVSTVSGELRPEVGWPGLIEATFPPGSVTGAPKSSALVTIESLEPVSRGPYCGTVGWVDATRRTAMLAVAIRTFWIEDGMLKFGTGAGITWGSDPQAEWEETELKAARLIELASAQDRPVADDGEEQR